MIPNLGVFVYWWNFAVRKIRGYWFQICQNNLQLLAPKYSNQAFLVPNLKIFLFALNFGAASKYDNNISKFQPQIGLVGSKSKNIYVLCKTLQQGKFEVADFKYDNCLSKLLPKTHK